MTGLFRPRNSRRPFGGVVNPFESSRPAPPSPPATPVHPSPNAWRTTFGPNPFSQPRPPPPPPPTTQKPRPQVRPARPHATGYQPHAPVRHRPYLEDVPYYNFQRRAFRRTPAAGPVAPAVSAAPAARVPLGHAGAAGTAVGPILPLLMTLAACIRDAASSCVALCAAQLVRAAGVACVVVPAVLRLLAVLLSILARCAVYGAVFWWFDTVFVRASAFVLRWASAFFLGWSWKTPARACRLRREYTSWSVSPMRAADGVAAASSKDGGASFPIDLTKSLSHDSRLPDGMTVFTHHLPWDGFDPARFLNISFVWNVTVTTVTSVVRENAIIPAERGLIW